jgi:hypothetical protein
MLIVAWNWRGASRERRLRDLARSSRPPTEPRFNPDAVYMVNESYTSGHLAPGDRVRIVDFAGRWLVAESLEDGSRALLEASNVERSP